MSRELGGVCEGEGYSGNKRRWHLIPPTKYSCQRSTTQEEQPEVVGGGFCQGAYVSHHMPVEV